MAFNSHADLFSSAAYQFLQQESMSVSALSRLLEAMAKLIKHATAMSTILAIELFQARHDAAISYLNHCWTILVMNWEMLKLILNNYLTIRSRKWQNLITKRNHLDF